MKPVKRNALLKNKGLLQRLNVKYNKLDPCACKLNVRSRLLVKPGQYLTVDPFRCLVLNFFPPQLWCFSHLSSFFTWFPLFLPFALFWWKHFLAWKRFSKEIKNNYVLVLTPLSVFSPIFWFIQNLPLYPSSWYRFKELHIQQKREFLNLALYFKTGSSLRLRRKLFN